MGAPLTELYRFAYRLAGNHQVAEDLVQEHLWRRGGSLGQQREKGKECAWCYRILRFRYAHFLRDRRHRINAGPLEEDLAISAGRRGVADVLAEREALQGRWISCRWMCGRHF